MSANLSELVIREVTTGIWTFSKPFLRFGLMPFGGRSTAVRLETGDVWVLASTPLTIDTKATIDNLGPVKWIVAADIEHHMFLGEFKKAYPEAKLIGVDGLAARKAQEGITLNGSYGTDSEGTTYGFEPEITACYFAGHQNKDVAFLHRPTKTLITADLLFNLPAKEQYSKSTSSKGWIAATSLNPYGTLGRLFAKISATDASLMKRDAKTVADWDFDRIIMCHGDVIETDGKMAWTTWNAKYLS